MSGGPFDTLVDTAKSEFDAAAHKPLLEAWQGLSLADVRADLSARLMAAGIDEGADESRFLINHVLAPARLADALADPALFSWQAADQLAALAWSRLARVPLSQVLGSQPFWTLDLAVTADVLTPRADTEALVEAVLAEVGRVPARLVDLGTGSGAILLALLSERESWTGLGVDLSAPALAVATANAARCGLANRAGFARGRWGTGLADGSADVLVSNPPYIVSDVLAGLEPEVREHEPALALDGGIDGLDAYREIIADLPRLLAPDGLFALEIGHDQGVAVTALARDAGLTRIRVLPDLAGHDRVVIGRRGPCTDDPDG
ncbi:peptide chain release factor N(5)-glutamine methyltransferase [Maricaulis sp.]|uniref:peptide chain release factor N(5)-glutamine methyltransferase n=1 Tax=Maricaulis sp. TaxID=1486257 RepID=UPI002B27540F|nr:peptide chain release factor N(5)-glutamine methyltransferase [Maricaulis sp.]